MNKVVIGVILSVSLCGGAIAQQYDLKEMTPAVTAALEARRDRFSKLGELKASGQVGENNRGYVEFLSGDAAVRALVAAENKDRKEIYQAIVDQNNLGAAALATVEKVFAAVQRDKAAAGDKVQDDLGRW